MPSRRSPPLLWEPPDEIPDLPTLQPDVAMPRRPELSGVVELELRIDARGELQSARVPEGQAPRILVAAALAAVQGKHPVASSIRPSFSFDLR